MSRLTFFSKILLLVVLFSSCSEEKMPEPVPEIYQQKGAFIKSLPYLNIDSCVMLIRRDVPQSRQGVVYQNMMLDSPEDSSLELAFEHLDAYEENFSAEDNDQIFIQYWRGNFFRYASKFDSARLCLNESYNISDLSGNYADAISAQFGLGTIYLDEGNFPQAIRSFMVAREAVEMLDSINYDLKYDALSYLGIAYNASHNEAQALTYAKEALALASDEKVSNFQYKEVAALSSISAYHLALNQSDSSILSAKNALELHEKYQTDNAPSRINLRLSSAYLAAGECEKALGYAMKEIDNPYIKSRVELHLAEIYTCLGRWTAAEKLFLRHIDMKVPRYLLKIYKSLNKVYFEKGKHELAYDALKKYQKLDRELFGTEKMQATGAAKIELELELEKRRAKEDAQAAKLDRQRTLTGLFFALFGLASAVYYILQQRAKHRIAEQEKELVESREILHLQELAEKESKLKNTQTALNVTKEALEDSNKLLAVKNQFIDGLQMQLAETGFNKKLDKTIESKSLFGLRILTEEEWGEFQLKFEEVFPGLLEKIRGIRPTLTPAERRLFLLIKAGFETSEIADSLGISQQSVYRARIRLGKKLGLESTTLLDGFVVDF